MCITQLKFGASSSSSAATAAADAAAAAARARLANESAAVGNGSDDDTARAPKQARVQAPAPQPSGVVSAQVGVHARPSVTCSSEAPVDHSVLLYKQTGAEEAETSGGQQTPDSRTKGRQRITASGIPTSIRATKTCSPGPSRRKCHWRPFASHQ